MTEADDFVANFLAHEYDPVKAHDYYLRTRKLKGKAAADAEYEKMNVADAQKTLNKDLKGSKVVMNRKRRVGAAEQKLIRAKSLAARIQDPAVKARILKRIAASEHKLTKIKQKTGVTHTPKKATTHHHTPKKAAVPPKKTLHKAKVATAPRSGTPLAARKNDPAGSGNRGPA